MLQLAWQFTKNHYSLVGVAAVIIMLFVTAFGQMGYLSILVPIPVVILNAGFLRLFRKLLETGKAELADIFVVFRETDILIKLLPIMIIGIAIGAFQLFVTNKIGFFGTLINFFLSPVMVALTAFSVPLMMFKNVDFGKSIELNVEATVKNWEFLLASGIMLTGLCVVCAILLLLPLFLIGFPISLVAGYLTYSMMFEGIELSGFKRTEGAPD